MLTVFWKRLNYTGVWFCCLLEDSTPNVPHFHTPQTRSRLPLLVCFVSDFLNPMKTLIHFLSPFLYHHERLSWRIGEAELSGQGFSSLPLKVSLTLHHPSAERNIKDEWMFHACVSAVKALGQPHSSRTHQPISCWPVDDCLWAQNDQRLGLSGFLTEGEPGLCVDD